MAISSETSSASFAGNNSTVTAYSLAFPFSGSTEIVVTHIEEDGTRNTLAVTTGYTLHGDYASGSGTLKTIAAIPVADTLLIERFTSAVQSLDSDSPAGSYPTSIETQLDRSTRAIQDGKRVASRNLARSLRVPDGELAAELPAAGTRAGKVPFFNATTGAVETKTPDQILGLSSGAPTGIGIPAGGTTGQALLKTASSDYAVQWGDPAIDAADVDTALQTTTRTQLLSLRDSLEAGDSFAGLSRLPLAVSRAWKEGRVADSRPPLTVLRWGDSLTESLDHLAMFPNMRFNGYKLMRADRAVVNAGSAPTATDKNWLLSYYRDIAASSTVEWTPPGAGIGIKANRVGVLYFKGASAANTFQLQYSQNNGGSWSTAATIDTSAATSEVTWFEFTLGNTPTNTRVRVVTSVGQTVKVIGCGVWFGDTENFAGLGGYVIADAWLSGLSPSVAAGVASATPTALSAPLAAMQVNMIIGSWADPVSCWDTGAEFDDIKTAVEGGIVPDWVFITPGPMGPATSPIDSGYTNGQLAVLIRDAMIAWAARQNQNVLDLYPRWRDWQTAQDLGFMTSGDEIHPTDMGDRYKSWFIGEMLSRELYRQQDALMIRNGPGNSTFFITADQYAVRSEMDPANPADVLWSHTGGFTASGAVTSTGAFTASSTVTIGGAIIGTPNSMSGAGAVSITTPATAVTTTAPAQALTLANGTAGQIKTIAHVATSGGGTAVLTPTTKTGYTTITFTNAGETATLQYFTTAGWLILSLRGAVAA
jgi:hypothetical protein